MLQPTAGVFRFRSGSLAITRLEELRRRVAPLVLVAAFATRGFCLDIVQLVLAEHRLVVGLTTVEELERILAENVRQCGLSSYR